MSKHKYLSDDLPINQSINQSINNQSFNNNLCCTGYIRDVTGSYIQVYHVIGGGMMVTAGLLCCEEPIRRLERRRQAARDQSSVLRQEYPCGNESDG